jgi:thioredoxin reductase (NADPH)
MDSSIPGWACVATIAVLFVVPMWLYTLVVERRTRRMRAAALAAGRMEPVTIQPMVDLAVCMGSGACVTACPERVFEVLENQAVAVNMAGCIGHGACVTACPVGAIELVFGSTARGIDIPQVGPDFQTNVPGLFIAGELGGMGLIASAVDQGRQAADNALAGVRPQRDVLDLLIVGAGPAGLAAAAAAKVAGRSYALIEQGDLGGAVRHYPRKKLVFTRPMVIPGFRKVNLKTLRKEELVELFEDVVRTLGLEVAGSERADEVTPSPGGGFTVRTSKRTIVAQRVVLALGRRGTPRKLGVAGEDLEKVAYSLLEPEQYRYEHLLVVGGGDSAVEAALALAEQPGNRVGLSYRGEHINRPKPKNLELLERAREAGQVEVLLGSNVTEITKDRVLLEQGGETLVRPNDQLFVMVGGVLPVKFLRAAGVTVEKHFGRRIEADDAPVDGRRPPAPAPPLAPLATALDDETVPRAQTPEPTVRLGAVASEDTVRLPPGLGAGEAFDGDEHPVTLDESADARSRAADDAARGDVAGAVATLVQALAGLAGIERSGPDAVAPLLAEIITLEGVLGDPAAALTHAEAALPWIARAPRHTAAVLASRAEVEAGLGLWDAARASLSAADWDAGTDEARIRGARAWCRLGAPEAALALLDAVAGGDGDPLVLAVRALALGRERPVDARWHANDALGRPQGCRIASATIRLDAGLALLAAGDERGARAAVKQGLKALQRSSARGLRLELALVLVGLGADGAVIASIQRSVREVGDPLPAPLSRAFLARPEVAAVTRRSTAVGAIG